ncbi:uncharacterized protein KY384_002191 [Bacidia gigantensis]|uniref:uncharacterized protein n=1 Tax=Bacidia gigantensis TaxID=2732470 RepID=UPI001D049335|nr:uncharacterized protein KY384_002191 [Bacidia gigantensis]KAG8533408.1 hypothetical protein KY384_002191 [Bacidia gigantensis]
MVETVETEAPKERFAPKDPPKDDPISIEELAKCDGKLRIKSYQASAKQADLLNFKGKSADHPTYVAIKGTVFDVSGNKAYVPGAGYNLFAGKDASRALAKTSLKHEDCSPVWEDLPEKEQKVLGDWYTFFEKRYNIVGKVQEMA